MGNAALLEQVAGAGQSGESVATAGGQWSTTKLEANNRATHRGAEIELHFTPNSLTSADTISLMQTVRVHKKSGDNWVANFGGSAQREGRKVEDDSSGKPAATNLDRRDGYSSPFFGIDDPDVIASCNDAAKGTGQTFQESRLRSGDGSSAVAGGKATDAWLWDSVWQTWSEGQQIEARFEVAAIARGGTDEGLVYGSVEWGFDVDATGTVTTLAPSVVSSGNASETFHEAVTAWNDQDAYEASMTVGAPGKRVAVKGIPTENDDWTLPSRDPNATDDLSVRQRAFEAKAKSGQR